MVLSIWFAVGLTCSLIYMATERRSGNPVSNFGDKGWAISAANIAFGGLSLLCWTFIFIEYAFPKMGDALTKERHLIKKVED